MKPIYNIKKGKNYKTNNEQHAKFKTHLPHNCIGENSGHFTWSIGGGR